MFVGSSFLSSHLASRCSRNYDVSIAVQSLWKYQGVSYEWDWASAGFAQPVPVESSYRYSTLDASVREDTSTWGKELLWYFLMFPMQFWLHKNLCTFLRLEKSFEVIGARECGYLRWRNCVPVLPLHIHTSSMSLRHLFKSFALLLLQRDYMGIRAFHPQRNFNL